MASESRRSGCIEVGLRAIVPLWYGGARGQQLDEASCQSSVVLRFASVVRLFVLWVVTLCEARSRYAALALL
jgi:hypothetical protein